MQLKIKDGGNSLAVQWLGLHISTAGTLGSIPGRGAKIPVSGKAHGAAKKKSKMGVDVLCQQQASKS